MGHTHDHHAENQGAGWRLGVSAIITLVLIVVEVIAGLLSNSLALLTDAAHNLTDVIALLLGWYAVNIARRPAHAAGTFGYHRVGILIALFNATTLVLIAGGIIYQAYSRFGSQEAIMPDVLVGVGSAALLVNAFTAWLLSRGRKSDLNLHSVFLHLMGDVVASVAAIAVGIGIWLTGLLWLDLAASILIALLIFWSAWGILQESVDILLEKTPADILVAGVLDDMKRIEGVSDVHDLHIWSITRSLRVLTAHVTVDADLNLSQGASIRKAINQYLSDKYNIQHATLQVEFEECGSATLYCNMLAHGHDDDHAH
ncbi:cation transporter [Candidatus Methylospira mobilis]|uniref:Cation transporter n=1 Tax=Candidatus Methylospira mobilis TaxID=1808979 RepID=A0A5Q0BMK6_9GAMM|nr:cation diffusion facilitator family transporter [Candidatus Methylospira mobilis]QFY43454.1 cation transporter [Candidatus Methylospira mobilis]WNV03307.1 cation diffusion facilitator family transporter [Candidatus Methylospira mobilis]